MKKGGISKGNIQLVHLFRPTFDLLYIMHRLRAKLFSPGNGNILGSKRIIKLCRKFNNLIFTIDTTYFVRILGSAKHPTHDIPQKLKL